MARADRLDNALDMACKLSDRHLNRYIRLRLGLEELCENWDNLSKGETVTTAAIRKIINDTWEDPDET